MVDVSNLKIYKLAKEIEIDARALTKKFPVEEKYSLTSQIRRAANSVGANIAEGAGRATTPDFIRFVSNSRGSLKELMHHVDISKSDNYITDSEYSSLSLKIDQLGKMLTSFMQKSKQ